jgi:hypothetical protein
VLLGITTLSPTNAWAVGYSDDPTTFAQHALIEHWNGTSWSIVSSPGETGLQLVLNAVAAVSANDIWAVGTTFGMTTSTTTTLSEHWNGSAWSIVPTLNPQATDTFSAVATISRTDVWAIGWSGNDVAQPLMEQWNGTAWSASTTGLVAFAVLDGVARVPGTTTVWAVGDVNGAHFALNTLTEQWNGNGWGVVGSPNGGSGTDQLQGVAATAANDLWAVGYDGAKTLIEHYHPLPTGRPCP